MTESTQTTSDKSYSSLESEATPEMASISPPPFSLAADPIQKSEDPNAESEHDGSQEHHEEVRDLENNDENAQEIIDQNTTETFWKDKFDFEGAAADIAELITHKNGALAQTTFQKVEEKHQDEVAYFVSKMAPLEGFEACELPFLQLLRTSMNDTEIFDGYRMPDLDAQKAFMDQIIANYNPLKFEFLHLIEKDRLSDAEIATCRSYVVTLDQDLPETQEYVRFLNEMEFLNLFDKARLTEEEIALCQAYIDTLPAGDALRLEYEHKLLEFKFLNLWEKESLTTEEVALCREYIESLEDGPEKEQYFLDLQQKAEYMNERNNKAEVWERQGGGTCNLTSLAMSLTYLGLSIPAEYQNPPGVENPNAVDQLYYIMKSENAKANQTHRTDGWWLPVPVVGGEVGNIMSGGVKKKAWWYDTLQAQYLAKGMAVMTSTTGHIVRVVGVSEAGVIVDDPFGKSTLDPKADKIKSWEANKTDRKENAYGSNDKNAYNQGEGTVWPWSAVEEFKFNWMDYVKKA